MSTKKHVTDNRSTAWACSRKFGTLMLFVDLRFEQGPTTHMVIDDKQAKKTVWEDEFKGHDMQEGKRIVHQRAIDYLTKVGRDRPDPDDELWKCSDAYGKPTL